MIVSLSSLDWWIVIPGHVVVSSKEKFDGNTSFDGGSATATPASASPANTAPARVASLCIVFSSSRPLMTLSKLRARRPKVIGDEPELGREELGALPDAPATDACQS